MDRHGFHTLGLHSTLRYVDTPLTPSTAKVGSAPLIPPLRPPALIAATKWHTGADAAPVFLWTPFPHPEVWLRRWSVLSALGGATRQHPPACHADHLPDATQETDYACVTAGVGMAFAAPSFHYTVR